MTQTRLTLTAVAALTLAVGACSRPSDAPSGPTSEPEIATEPAAAPADAVAASQAPSAETACRQAVQTQYGQEGGAVTFTDGTISWRAPVDGGRLSFACAVNGQTVTLTREGETRTITLNTAADPSVQQEAH